MTDNHDASEGKSGVSRRAVIGALAAATAFPSLVGEAKAQTPSIKPKPVSRQKSVVAIARSAHSTTPLSNGLILIAGGIQFTAAPLSSVQIYDPFRNVWYHAAPLNPSRFHHAAAPLSDGRILVCGGIHAGGRAMTVCEIYDPRTDSWSAAAPLNVARCAHAATPLANGSVLVMGGSANNPVIGGSTTRTVAVCEIYDPARDVWEILDPTS